MLLRAPKLICGYGQQKTSNATVPDSSGEQGAAFEIKYQCVGRCFCGERVLHIGPPEQLAGKVEARDAARAVLKRSATSDNSINDQENVIGGVSFTHDYLIAMVTDGASPKRDDSAMHQSLVLAVDKRAV